MDKKKLLRGYGQGRRTDAILNIAMRIQWKDGASAFFRRLIFLSVQSLYANRNKWLIEPFFSFFISVKLNFQ